LAIAGGPGDGAGWRVFVSHTAELRDFPAGKSYVAAVERAISACGHVIVDMADFPVADQPPAELCVERVRGCHVYVGVLGTRYGSPVRDKPEVSYTELEFDTATKAGLDRLVFLLDTDADEVGIPLSKLIDHEFGARQEAFRRRVRDSGLVTAMFTHPATLEQLVERSLRALAEQRRHRGNSGSQRGQIPAVVMAGEIPQEPLGFQPRTDLIVAMPRQLPAAVAGFEGRATELGALTSLLEEAALPGGTVVISAIDGTAGIGKTALAVQWAHQVAGRFPDGQLYVNLRGFDPAGPPVTPAEAVRGFLDAFEVPAARIPVSLDAQAALYRSLLAGRRVLVLVDNAGDTSQVWPLLPGSPGCCVVVTSRNRLTGLIANGARPLTVDLLTDADAREMLARRMGADRVAAQPQAVQQIIARCARLPLALSIVAARAAAHPAFPLTALAEELHDAEGRQVVLDAGEAATSVTAVFSWSYRQLSDQAARMFRLLGLHPGPDITAPAAASLAAVPVPAARPLLAELARAHLITEHTPGRFSFHDLLRAYATTQTRTHDPGTDRNAARQRMLDHYLHTAQAAWYLSYPHQQQAIILASPLPGVTPEEPADYPAARAWFTAEYPVLLAAIQLAADTGHHTHAWQLPHMLVPFFERQGHWHDFTATHHTALTATEDNADQQGQAHAHLGIGHARARIGRLDEARLHLQHALRLFEELGDQAGQSDAHSWLGLTFHTQECYEEALTHTQQAVNLARTGGYQRGLAAALNVLGWVHALIGNAQQALTYSQQSLALLQDLGDRWGEAAALNTIGYAHHHLGHHHQAASYFEQALTIDRELGDLYSEATDYDHLGDALHAAGNTTQARHAWQLALNILDQLGDVPRMSGGYANPDAIRTKLRHHD
jgi:tetratricopeptide (TPR) repeat protein